MVENLEEKADEMQKATEEPAAEDSGTGNKPQTGNVLESIRRENERMEANLSKRERLVEREEQIAAARMLGGGTEAGQIPRVETQEDKDKKVVEDMLSRFD